MNMLSIIIPVYNEKATVEALLASVAGQDIAPVGKEIIVVDDGSTDGTGELLARLAAGGGFALLRHDRNRGKGAAIRTGLARASGDLVLIQDADLEYDPADHRKLLAAFGPDAPVVYGSRYLGRNPIGYTVLNWGNNFLTWFTNVLFGSRLTDINTCYKLFRADIIKGLGLRSDGFDFEIDVTAKVLRAGYAIREVPIRYDPRRYEAGKKIRPVDGLRDAAAVIRYRFGK
jgi:glycosyltransferase involved in cell wall biosynthesis